MLRTLHEGSLADVRVAAGRRIKRHREVLEYPVTIIERGVTWELESDPDGMSMVGDFEGHLQIEVVCDGCGAKAEVPSPPGREGVDDDHLCDDCAAYCGDDEDFGLDMSDVEFCEECGACLEFTDVDSCKRCQMIIDGDDDEEGDDE